MRSVRRSVAASVVAALCLSACTDDGEGTGAPLTTEAPDPEARARAVNLTLDDLPEEFVAAPAEGDAADSRLRECLDSHVSDDVLAQAESPVFERASGGGLVFVTSSTSVLDDEDAGAGLLGALQEPATVDCLGDVFTRALIDSSSGATLQGSNLERAPGLPAFGEESTALTGSVTFTAPPSEQPVELAYTFVAVRTGTVVSFLLSGGVLDAFPPETLVDLTGLVADRQRNIG